MIVFAIYATCLLFSSGPAWWVPAFQYRELQRTEKDIPSWWQTAIESIDVSTLGLHHVDFHACTSVTDANAVSVGFHTVWLRAAGAAFTPTVASNYLVHECGHLREKHPLIEAAFLTMVMVCGELLFWLVWIKPIVISPMPISFLKFLIIAGLMFWLSVSVWIPRFHRLLEYRADRWIARYGDVPAQLTYWYTIRFTYQASWTHNHPSYERRARALARYANVPVPSWCVSSDVSRASRSKKM